MLKGKLFHMSFLLIQYWSVILLISGQNFKKKIDWSKNVYFPPLGHYECIEISKKD